MSAMASPLIPMPMLMASNFSDIVVSLLSLRFGP
jgi:hypothetical protein